MEMIPKRGNIRQWHFAHKADVKCTSKPDPDNALHRYAQDIILDGFNCSKEGGVEYLLGVKCTGFHTDICDGQLAYNVALPDSRMAKEVSVIQHTRSDLVLFKTNNSKLILEVVNTHSLDADTKERYLQSKIPVFIRTLTWDNLPELSTKFISDEALNIESKPLCVQCLQRKESFDAERKRELAKEEKRKEKRRYRKQIIDRAIKRLVRTRCREPQFRPWYKVKKEIWPPLAPEVNMYPKTQKFVFANAIILTELGFKQHNPEKPWLFRFKIHEEGKYIYADLGGNTDVPIYRDTAAMLYAPDLEDDNHLAQYAVEQFAHTLLSHGVNMRVGVRSGYGHVDPIRHVDPDMLKKLVMWDSRPEKVQATRNPITADKSNLEQSQSMREKRRRELESERQLAQDEDAEALRRLNDKLKRSRDSRRF